MRFLTGRVLPLVYRSLAVLAVVGAVTLLLRPLQGYLGVQVVALIYLLPVILATFLWGLPSGALAGLASFFLYNYFFLPPYHTLAVHQSQDLITLVVFLVVAVIVSQLIGKARAGTQLAKQREWEATRMYALISALAGLQDIESIGRTLAQQALETFRAERAEVVITGQALPGPLTISAPPETTEQRAPGIRCPMMTARRTEGEIRLWLERPALTDEENRLLNTFASQGALAIERIHLSQSETRARIFEETDRAKSSLLSSVSHELRTPLAAIKASVSSLASEAVGWDTEGRQELLETIEEETDKLNYLVGNLLDMTRIEAGALKPRRQWNALAEIANGAIARLRKPLQGYPLVLNFAENLPLVPVDYALIEQVFANLLSNSAKFAPPGTPIELSAARDGDMVQITVTNRGPRVAEADLERIFDKFTEVTGPKNVTSTGLGLSICKGIIEAHEGRIWAENLPDRFAFRFMLPVKLDGQVAEVPPEG